MRKYYLSGIKKSLLSISVVGLLLTGAIPLFPTGEAGGAGLPPLLLDSFHLWDFNIKDINGKYWKYEARTDLYSVKFPVDIDGDSAELEVFGGKYALKMIVNDLECTDFDGRENGTFFLEDPLEDEPVVDGVTITYPDIYDDIDLEYEICYDQCKETFIIKNLSNSIHGNLMFNNTIEYNVSALRVFCGGERVNDTYYGVGEDIEFRDDLGSLVYRIPKPVMFDTPDDCWDPYEESWIKDLDTRESIDCPFRLELIEEGFLIRYDAPYRFLTAPSTRYPVYLDPALSYTIIEESITYEGLPNGTIRKTDPSGATYYQGSDIIMLSNVTIMEGGGLTLNNVTLKIDGSEEATLTLKVDVGGMLNLVNGTLVTWGENESHYCIDYMAGSMGCIDGATLEHISDEHGGLALYSEIIVLNSTIRYCQGNGIYVRESSPLIYGNSIINNSASGVFVGFGGAPKIYGNNLSGNEIGLNWNENCWRDTFINQSKLSVLHNTVLSGGEITPQDWGNSSYADSEEIPLKGGNLFDRIHLDGQESSDCNIVIDVLDGEGEEEIAGLANLSGNILDISGINPYEHSSIRLRCRFLGNRSSGASIKGWEVFFRATESLEGKVGSQSDMTYQNTHLFGDSLVLNGTGFNESQSNFEDFGGDSLDPMWVGGSYGTEGSTEADVDGAGYVEAVNYGSGASWHGPMLTANLSEINRNFVLEAKFSGRNSYPSMGFSQVEVLNGTDDRLFMFLWKDSWNYNYRSQVVFKDGEGVLYASTAGTDYNDFGYYDEGRMKVTRSEGGDVEYFLDNGDGYEKMTLSGEASEDSLLGQAAKLRIVFAKSASYPDLPVHRMDWVSFCGDFCEKGSFVTEKIYPGPNSMWDSIAVDRTEPDNNHYVTTTVLDGRTGIAIEGYSFLRGSMIDIGGIPVSEHNCLRLRFDLHGNGSSSPELHGWRLGTNPTVHGNQICDNTVAGVLLNLSAPAICFNDIVGNGKGIICRDSPGNALISEDYQDSYEISHMDEFLHHGGLLSWANITIIDGMALLDYGKAAGHLISRDISLPASSRWEDLSCTKYLPEGCHVNISVLDASTGETIEGFSGLEQSRIDLRYLDTHEYGDIRIRADFTDENPTGTDTGGLLNWQITTKRLCGFNDTFADSEHIDGGVNFRLTNGDITLSSVGWWNDDYRYRRNLTFEEELGINRSNEYHDVNIDFSDWPYKPSCADEVRVVQSNGTEASREVTEFIPGEYVNMTIFIEDVESLGGDHIHVYYGCDEPSAAAPADYPQTVLLLDENGSVTDLGGGAGPANVADASIGMVGSKAGVVPPRGSRMAELLGDDSSGEADSYWFAEFSNNSRIIPEDQYLGYYIYQTNVTGTTARSGGIDGNYSGGGTMGSGEPVALDQNGLGLAAGEDISQYASNSWYYRYTDDLGGETITNWYMTYDDVENSQTGDFAIYLDYVFIGPNRGPLSTTLGGQETKYESWGYVISEPVDLPSRDAVWDSLGAGVDSNDGGSVSFGLLDAETLQPIEGYSNISGADTSLLGIHPDDHPSLRIAAYLSSDGTSTPSLHWWSLDGLRRTGSGMITANSIRDNGVGIEFDGSQLPIIGNELSSNTDAAIHITEKDVGSRGYFHFTDGTYRESHLDSGGMVYMNLTVPDWRVPTDIEIYLSGSRYIPQGDMERTMVLSGWITDEETEMELNGTLSLDRPGTWAADECFVYYEHIESGGSEMNASSASVSVEHDGDGYGFNDTSRSLEIPGEGVCASQDPLLINVTTNGQGVSGNFSATGLVDREEGISWSSTEIGYTLELELEPPDADVVFPVLLIEVPQGGFAAMECHVVETDEDVTSLLQRIEYPTSGLELDLYTMDDFGEVWNSSDPTRTIRINLSYHAESPALDVGADGYYEWELPGELNGSIAVTSANVTDGLNAYLETGGSGTSTIPLGLNVSSAAHVNISAGIRMESIVAVAHNDIDLCGKGIFIENGSGRLLIRDNDIRRCDVAVQINSTNDGKKTMNFSGMEDHSRYLSLEGKADDGGFFRLPANSLVSSASFNLTGDRHIPGVMSEQTGYETLATYDASFELSLNDTLTLPVPSGWEMEKAVIRADEIERENGEAMAVWSFNSTGFDHARLKDGKWTDGLVKSVPELLWIEGACEPGGVNQTFLMLNASGVLSARGWNGECWSSEKNMLTDSASSSNRTCFDVVYLDRAKAPLAVYSNDSTGIEFVIFEEGEWAKAGDVEWSEATWIEAVPVPGTDHAVILTLNAVDDKLTALYWNGSGVEHQWTLTEDVSNGSLPCFSVSRAGNGKIVAAWGNGSGELCVATFEGSQWSETVTVELWDVNAVKSTGSQGNNDTIILAGSSTGNLTAVLFNGTGIEGTQVLSTSLSDPGTVPFDGRFDNTGRYVTLWGSGGSALEWSEFDGDNWSEKESLEVQRIRWISGSGDPNTANITFLTLDSEQGINGYEWNGSAFLESVNLEGVATSDGTRCMDILFECPFLSVRPSHIGLVVEQNGTKRYFSETVDTSTFLAEQLGNAAEYTFQVNRTAPETVNGTFSLLAWIANHTTANWTVCPEGYYMDIELYPPDVNVSEPIVRVFTPNTLYSSVSIEISGQNETVPSELIGQSGRGLDYITIDLSGLSDTGSIWGPEDGIINLNVTLGYDCADVLIDIGADGTAEWSHGPLNSTVTINETEGGLAAALETRLDGAHAGYVRVPVVLRSSAAANITMGNVSVEYESVPVLSENTIRDSDVGIRLKGNSSVSSNIIEDCSVSGVEDMSPASSIRLCELSDNEIGIYLNGSGSRVTGNIIGTGKNSGNSIGIMLYGSCAVMKENEIGWNDLGISVYGNQSDPLIRANEIMGNEVALYLNGSAGTINSNLIRENDIGVSSNNSSAKVVFNDIRLNGQGLYCQYNDGTSLCLGGNEFAGNGKGINVGADGAVNATECFISGNEIGILIAGDCNATISEMEFVDNEVGLRIRDAAVTVEGCSFAGNAEVVHTTGGGELSMVDSCIRRDGATANWGYQERPLTRYMDGDHSMMEASVGDVNGDGEADIVTVDRKVFNKTHFDHHLTVFPYDPETGEFDEPEDLWLQTAESPNLSLELADLDSDGDLEMITADDDLRVFDWSGSSLLETGYSPVSGSEASRDMAAGDVNNDSYTDVVCVDLDENEIDVFLWDPDSGDFDSPLELTTLDDPCYVFLEDTNGDGMTDVLLNYLGRNVSIFKQNAEGFDNRVDLEFSEDIDCRDMALGDLDGDGDDDLMVSLGDELGVRYYNSSSSSFDGESVMGSDIGSPAVLHYLDCDGDGSGELVMGGGDMSGTLVVYRIVDMELEEIERVEGLVRSPDRLAHGLLSGDQKEDMIYSSPDGSGGILYWNDSVVRTARNVKFTVDDDDGEGIEDAQVKVFDSDDAEMWSGQTNENGDTQLISLEIEEIGLDSRDVAGPYRIEISKKTGETWYNVTRSLNLSTGELTSWSEWHIGNDSDSDGLSDGEELFKYGTDPEEADTDGDGLKDGTEVGIDQSTAHSTTGETFVPDQDPDTRTSPLLDDTDGDGLPDGVEDADLDGKLDEGETDPDRWDTDNDGLPDGWMDLDHDGEKDPGEYEDADLDGTVDAGDWGQGGETDPTNGDTDSGGIGDFFEVVSGENPLNGAGEWSGQDGDGDGWPDAFEDWYGTDDEDEDTDGDGWLDGMEWRSGMDPASNDSDGDGANDDVEMAKSEEGEPVIVWYEAENCSTSGNVVSSDEYLGAHGVKLDEKGEILRKRMDATLNGAVKVGVRIRGNVSIGLSNGLAFKLSLDNHTFELKCRKNIGYIETPVIHTGQPMVDPVLTVQDTTESAHGIWIDAMYVVRTDSLCWQTNSSQYTNPTRADTDLDGLLDSSEMRYDPVNGQTEAWWFQGEEHAVGMTSVTSDPEASNSMAAVLTVTGESHSVHGELPLAWSDGGEDAESGGYQLPEVSGTALAIPWKGVEPGNYTMRLVGSVTGGRIAYRLIDNSGHLKAEEACWDTGIDRGYAPYDLDIEVDESDGSEFTVLIDLLYAEGMNGELRVDHVLIFDSTGPPADPMAMDLDHDGLTDGEEAQLGTDPTDPDSDDDGLWDGWMDTDMDGVWDEYEGFGEAGDPGQGGMGGSGTDPTNPDTDGDGLWDGGEGTFNCDPMDWDSDNDGMPDGYEVYTLLRNGQWDPLVRNKRYALLMGVGGGAVYPCMWDDLVQIKEALIAKYYYNPNNIYVYYRDGNERYPNDHKFDDVHMDAFTDQKVKDRWTFLSNRVGASDMVFNWIDCHGSSGGGIASLRSFTAFDRNIKYHRYFDPNGDYTGKINNFNKLVFTIEADYGGEAVWYAGWQGFNDVLVSSACDRDEGCNYWEGNTPPANDELGIQYQYFDYIDAWNGGVDTAFKINNAIVDAQNGGHRNMQEAHEHGRANDPWGPMNEGLENPVIWGGNGIGGMTYL